ncbi:hypothetical protein CR513_52488, partial [Mucuna pruriens]
FRYCTLLTCTTKGNASIRSIEVADSSTESSCVDSPKTWHVCSGGNILCCKVDGNETFALFGGKGVEMNVWDLNNFTKIWNSKSVSLFFTSTPTFHLCHELLTYLPPLYLLIGTFFF